MVALTYTFAVLILAILNALGGLPWLVVGIFLELLLGIFLENSVATSFKDS
jgi:hypothetical protein